MELSLTPSTAVTAADPYGYYARLTRDRPFAFDADLNLWVAAGAVAVEAALSDPGLRVRPPSEPVPRAMLGTSLGDVFARLARMNDGPRHRALRGHVRDAVDRWNPVTIFATALRCARALAAGVGDAADLTAYLHDVPALSVAEILNVPSDELASVRDFARAIAPNATPGDVARGIAATARLKPFFGKELGDDRVANALGFLFQSYDATAGLIGNALVALIADEELRRAVMREEDALDAHLSRTERYDPPVHNTRRFAAVTTEIAGTRVEAGDRVLVLLAAANRDPLAARSYTFGIGPHACPGARAALTIAKAGVTAILERAFDLMHADAVGFQASLNVRIPVFAARA